MSDNTLSKVLSCLDAFYIENALKFFIPSLQKEVDFKPMSIDQQRRFIDLNVQNSHFQRANFADIYDKIIEECCLEDVDIDSLTVLDRSVIALQHRAEIDDELKLILSDGEDTTFTVKVSDYVKNTKTCKKVVGKTLKHKNMKVNVSIPTTKRDKQFDRLAKDLIEYKEDASDLLLNANTDENMSELLILEVAKYVDSFVLDGMTISVDDVKPEDFVTILKKLPGIFLKRLSTQLPKFKEFESAQLTLSQKVGNKSHKVAVEVDSVLFTGV